ncbi:MAG: GDSL-type esterase/lipase family protein [Planktothrix sp. GU0601_MAG3]|nr:MAG: GDSL-type esterase/lipase family protein [Planktothrix sp. GU0601_MAG3]
MGGNDFLQKLPKTETEANLKEIVTKIQEKQAIAVLLGINLGLFTDEYAEIYQRVAQETQAYLIPQILEGIIDNPKYRQEDFIHPNAAGHQRLGERVAKDLKPLLEKAKKPELL